MRCPTLSELPPPPPGKTGWPWTEESPQLPDTMPDDSPWPRVSIITPSYNQAQFIEETIRSVLLQGYPNLEYIIMDGGSTDNSVEIIKRYAPWLTYWVSEPDRGQSHAINKGWRRATGEILAWLNSDDMYCPGAVSRVVEAYFANRAAVVFYGDCHAISRAGEHLYTRKMQEYASQMLCGRFPAQPSAFFLCTVLDEVGFVDEGLHYAMDGDFFLRIWHRCSESRFHYVPYPLASQRLYPGTKVSQGDKQAAALEIIFDRFFAQDDLDKEVLAMRRNAYSNVSSRRASFALKNNRRAAAVRHRLKAILLAPTLYQPLKVMRFFAIALLPGLVLEYARRVKQRARAFQRRGRPCML